MSNVSGLGDSQIDEILHDVDPEAIGIVPDDYVAEGYGEIADFEDAEGTGGCFGDPVYEPELGGIFDDVGIFGGGFGDPVYVPENSGFFNELITGNESAGGRVGLLRRGRRLGRPQHIRHRRRHRRRLVGKEESHVRARLHERPLGVRRGLCLGGRRIASPTPSA